MALAKGAVIGKLSGKLGDLTARTRAGKTYYSAQPVSFNSPKDPATLDRRKKFLCTIRFALEVLALPVLKEVWDIVKLPGLSAYNMIARANYHFSTPERSTLENIITPGGFELDVQNALIGADSVTATIPALNTITDISPNEVHCSFNAVIFFHTPLTPGDPPYNIIHLSKMVPNFNFAQAYDLVMNLSVGQAGVAAKYDSSILYLAAVPKTADEKILQCSDTYSKAF